MIRSKFKIATLVAFNFCVLLLILLTGTIFMFYEDFSHDSLLSFVLIVLLIFFIFLWLIWGEMRTRILKVSIENDRICVNNYQGLGTTKVIFFTEVDGFKTCILPSEYKDYEYLYIIRNGKKIVKISEFYHKNYMELKNEIAKKCKNLGAEKFSFVRAIREIF